MPLEQRTLARLGNLGWDTRSEELQRRGDELLVLAGVTAAEVIEKAPIVSRRGTGSSMQILFATPASLQRAKLGVRRAARQFEPGRTAWLDVQKSEVELRPSRVLQTLLLYLTDLEADRPQPKVLEKRLPARTICEGDIVLCRVAGERVRWSAAGMLRWDAGTRRDAEAIALSR